MNLQSTQPTSLQKCHPQHLFHPPSRDRIKWNPWGDNNKNGRSLWYGGNRFSNKNSSCESVAFFGSNSLLIVGHAYDISCELLNYSTHSSSKKLSWNSLRRCVYFNSDFLIGHSHRQLRKILKGNNFYFSLVVPCHLSMFVIEHHLKECMYISSQCRATWLSDFWRATWKRYFKNLLANLDFQSYQTSPWGTDSSNHWLSCMGLFVVSSRVYHYI